jgi:glycosyltransferase involved in cell wall biosynthesis
VTNSNLKKEFSKIIKKEKIELIHNGSVINPSSNKPKKFIISYFGLINKFRNPKVLIDVIDELLSENNEIKEKLEFHIYGNIQHSTISYLKQKNNLIESLKIKTFIDFKKLQNRFDSSSVLLLLLNNNQNQNTTPYKIFDYLVSERPILTLSNFKNPDVEYFLKKYKRNKSFTYDDRQGIKDFIISTFNTFNEGKLKNIRCDYSNLRYDRLAKKYRDIIES